MQALHPRCAGLDVHKYFVMAAVRLAEAGGARPGRKTDVADASWLA